MVSADTDWSSGAKGIACDAAIAARLRPIANADAARIFMKGSFPVGTRRNYDAELCKYCGGGTAGRLTTDAGASDDGAIDASDGGASDASPNDGGANGGDASPNDGDAIAGASDDAPSALVRA
jgi:hypothetical protein